MAIKNIDGSYSCAYCKKIYANPFRADECRESHKLYYIPMTKEELNGLVNFIYFKQEKLLNPNLVNTLRKFLMVASRESD